MEAKGKQPEAKKTCQRSAISDQWPQIDSCKSKASTQLSLFPSHFSLFTSCFSLLALLTAFVACDQDFQPLEENNELFFSMYGYLDASADTQWIHITPVREQVEMLTEAPDMLVTLENVNTGQQIIMKDSLFQSRGVNFLNFWTSEPIEYDQEYKLMAELPGGKKSEVHVLTPEEMPLPKLAVFTRPGATPDYFVLVDSRVNLADIQTKYYIRVHASNLVVPKTISFPYRNITELSEDYPGFYVVEIKPEEEIKEIERQVLLPPDGEIEVVYRQVFVATSGIEWDEAIESLDDITYALPQSLQNVTNGLGYVIGIDSKYIPYSGCVGVDGSVISCGAEEPFW